MMTALDELIPESKIGYFFNHADLISYNIDPHEKRDPDIELFDAVTGEKIDGAGDFYREKKRYEVWRLEAPDSFGINYFTFDKKNIYDMFRDYPHSLTNEEKELFDIVFPNWKEFFNSRGDI